VIVRTAAAVLAFAFAARAARPSDDPILRIEVGMHTSHVTRIGIDRGGRSLLSASDDKTARLWDVRTGELLRVLRPPIAAGPEGKLYAAALSADGTVAAVAGWTELGSESGHTIYLFESRTGALLRRIGGLPNCVMSLAFSIDGSRLAAGLGSQGIRVFHQADGALLFADEDYKGDVYGLDFDAAGRLATTSYDGAVRLYDEAGRRIAKRVAPHGARPLGVAFSPDGVSLAVGYSDVAAVDVLSAADLQPKFSADTSNVKRPLAIVGWSADGETLAAGGTHPTEGTKRIRLFRSGGRGAPIDVDAASGTVKDIKATPDGGFVFGAADPLLGVLNANGARRVLRDSPLADHRGRALRASQDGKTVAFAFEYDRAPASFSLEERSVRMGPPGPGLAEPLLAAKRVAISDWQSGTHPKSNGQLLPLQPFEVSHALAVATGGDSFLLGTEFGLRHFDSTGKELWQRSQGTVWAVTFAAEGRLAIAAFGDGTIRWFRASDGQELLAFFPHADRVRWVLWTPSGYYDASPGGEDLIGWHVNRGRDREADFFSASRFRAGFYRPDVISRVLGTLDEARALAQANEVGGRKAAPAKLVLPPIVRILSPSNGDAFTTPSLQFRFSARSPGGAPMTAVHARIDGRPAAELRAFEKGAGAQELVLSVALPARDCIVSVFAEAGDAVGEPDTVRLRWVGAATASEATRARGFSPAPSDDPPEMRPKLYVLAVGVSKYADPSYRLDFAAKDARDVVAVLEKQKGRLYSDVITTVLTDEEATRDNVVDKLDWLQKQTTHLDTAILFLAGHGVNDPSTGLYNFLPVAGNPDKRSTLLPGSEIKTTIASIHGKVVVLLDTCHAGNVLNEPKLRGGDSNGFVNELSSAESGIVVFTAAAGRQSSQESTKWGNGAFTKAFVEALSGEADFRKTGRVTINMIDLYVSDRVKQLTSGQQTPVTAKPMVQDFPLAMSP